MTGLQLLKNEMRNRGLQENQIESKAVAVVLDILSGGEFNIAVYDAKRELSSINHQIESAKWELKRLNDEHTGEVTRVRKEAQELKEFREELEDYIASFEKSLKECETAEARDMMRRVQLFIDSVDVATKYDNTAYIIGLASILSNGSMDAIAELRKINNKLPDPKFAMVF